MGAHWSPTEDAKLIELRAQGLTWPQIAARLDRTDKACSGRNEWMNRVQAKPDQRRMWSLETRAEMVRLWLQGLSATDISNQLGIGNRSAVIGVVHRSGKKRDPAMSLRNMHDGAKKAAAKSVSVRPIKFKAERAELRPMKAEPITPDRRPLRCAPVEPLNIPIIDIQRSQCRYPAETPEGFSFCGHRTEGGSWCTDHQRIVFTPSNDKRKATGRLKRAA